MVEEWRDVVGFEDYYSVSNLGTVFSKRSNRVLKHGHIDGDYRQVTFSVKGVKHFKYVHVLVAESFIGVYPHLQVNHIDGRKNNNRLDNLEYLSVSDNLKHAFTLGLKKPSGGVIPKRIRIVETGEEFPSQRDCARHINGSQGAIGSVLRGEWSSYRGMTFEYV